MRYAAIGCLLALGLAGPAHAEDRVWLFNDDSDSSSLQYGTPESDDVVIAMTCEPAEKIMRIVEFVATDKVKPGAPARFKLSAGTQSVELTGDAIANESDGAVIIEVTGPPRPRVFAVLRGGPTLTVEVEGGKETIPLAGAAQYVGAFEKICLGTK